MQTVAGIDLGTQSLKVIIYDPQSRLIVANTSVALDLNQNEDGTAEQQASWWTDALATAMGKIDSSIRASVTAIGISGQQHGFVPLDKTGEVIAPVKLWCDTSTERECEEIMQRFGGRAACIEETGNPVVTGYTAPKIAWLKRHHPDLYANLDCILLPHDYLNFFLTGERCMEAGDASGTGMLNVTTRQWCTKMLGAIDPDRDLSACLPPVYIGSGIAGELQSSRANHLGLSAGIPVSTGGGDNMMGAIGTGNLAPGAMTISLGTSGTVYAYSSEPVIDPDGNVAAFCSSTGGWLPLLCTMNCTVTTELMRRLLNHDLESFESQVAGTPPGANGLLTLPFFNGERTPNLPRGKGCMVGMDAHNMNPESLLRSGMEGATFALRQGVDDLRRLGITTERIALTGGGMHSATWRQMVADIFQTSVTVYEQDEGASFGAALQALSVSPGQGDKTLDEIVTDHLVPNESLSCEPNSDAARVYDDVFYQYQRAVKAITGLYCETN